jgi:predicted hotdog family 3-hydroxylacyl-ACP dehydratase
MIWIRAVLAHDANETACLVAVDDVGAIRDPDGGVGAHVAIEWMAQAVAAHAGLERRARGEAPRIGLLLGSKRVRLARPAYNRGERFRVVAVRSWGGEQGAVSFDCRVESLDGALRLAEARLSCFMPGEDRSLAEALQTVEVEETGLGQSRQESQGESRDGRRDGLRHAEEREGAGADRGGPR